MRITLLFLSLICILQMISSCTKDKPNEVTGINPCDTTYFALTIRPIITTKCMGNNAGCHIAGGSGSGDFSKYIQLKDKVDQGAFKDRVLTIKDMPPSTTPLPVLSDAERTLLEDWADNGAVGCD